MRQRHLHLTLVAMLLVGGCGGSPKKDAKDPSESAGGTDDPAPKWDESSESADDARHPHFSGGSSTDRAAAEKPEAAPPPPQSSPQQQHRDDQYDKDATEMVLKRAARIVHDNCGAAKDENGKATGPWGKTTVQVDLGHNGRTKGATVDPSYDGKPAGRCIIQAFSNLTYPPWRGSDTTVSWDVEVVQPK